MIANSNLCDPTTEELAEVRAKLKEGDDIKVVVLDVNTSKQKLSLSRKDYFRQMHKKDLERYIHDDSQQETVTLGDLIKDKTTE